MRYIMHLDLPSIIPSIIPHPGVCLTKQIVGNTHVRYGYYYYTDEPEVALRYYRRLLQMGANSPEVWQNLGLCCFYASQYDMALKCMERALAMASDDIAADIWYGAVGYGACGWIYRRGGRAGVLTMTRVMAIICWHCIREETVCIRF